MSYSAIVDVDHENYETEALVTAARRQRIGFVIIPIFFVLIVSFICMCFVEEDLKRLRYKKTASEEDKTSSVKDERDDEY